MVNNSKCVFCYHGSGLLYRVAGGPIPSRRHQETRSSAAGGWLLQASRILLPREGEWILSEKWNIKIMNNRNDPRASLFWNWWIINEEEQVRLHLRGKTGRWQWVPSPTRKSRIFYFSVCWLSHSRPLTLELSGPQTRMRLESWIWGLF